MNDWQSELSALLSKQDQSQQPDTPDSEDAWTQSSAYFSGTVVPALQEIEYELEKHDRDVMIFGGANEAYIDVTYKGIREIKYYIKITLPDLRPYTEIEYLDTNTGKAFISKGIFRVENRNYSLEEIGKDVIINDFLSEYYAHHS